MKVISNSTFQLKNNQVIYGLNIKKEMNHKKLKISITIFIILLLSEFVLRHYFGFCDAVLMQEDPDFEYISRPDQNRYRFGKHIYYNHFSMRSEEVDSTAEIILGFGDSIFNGGTFLDQDSIASTILSKNLTKQKGHKIQFLNISSGSWGPDNCFAYLKKYGNFNCKKIYLIVSSHDAYDNMNFEKVVGIHFRYPNKQYKLALLELVDRYIIPETKKKLGMNIYKTEESELDKKGINTGFNSGFNSFYEYAKRNKIPLTIYLHASKSEIKQNHYNEQGVEIINFAKSKGIPLLTDLQNGITENDLRDKIHYSNSGQKKMADIIIDKFCISAK